MSIGAEWYLLELLQFILNPSWLCNMETDRALAQKAELVWLDAVQYPEYHGAVCRPKQTASLFISRKMENLEQTVPAFWPPRDYLVWPLLSFLVLSNQTPYHALFPNVDLTAHFETDLLDGLGLWVLFGMF